MTYLDGSRRDTDPSLQSLAEVQSIGEIEPHYSLDYDLLRKVEVVGPHIENHLGDYTSKWVGYDAVIREIRSNPREYNTFPAGDVSRAYRKLFPDAEAHDRPRTYPSHDTVDEILAIRDNASDYLRWKHPFSPPKRPVISNRGGSDVPRRSSAADEAEAHVHSELGRRFAGIMALDVMLASPATLSWHSPDQKRTILRDFQYDFISNLFSTAEDIASLHAKPGRIARNDRPSFDTRQLPDAAALAVSTLFEASHALLKVSQDYTGGCEEIRSYRHDEPSSFSQHPLIAMSREFVTTSAVIANHLTPAFRHRHDVYVDEVAEFDPEEPTTQNISQTGSREARDNLGQALVALDATYAEIGSVLLDRLDMRVAVLEHQRKAGSGTTSTDGAKAELTAIGEVVAALGIPTHVRSSRHFEAWGKGLLERIEALTGEQLPKTHFLWGLGQDQVYDIGVPYEERRHRRFWSPGDFSDTSNR